MRKGKSSRKGKKTLKRKVGGSIFDGFENSLLVCLVCSFITMVMYRMSISPDANTGATTYKNIQDSRKYVLYVHGGLLIAFFVLGKIFDGFKERFSYIVSTFSIFASMGFFLLWFTHGIDIPIREECAMKDGKMKDDKGDLRNLNSSSFFFFEEVAFWKQGAWIVGLGVFLLILKKFIFTEENIERGKTKLTFEWGKEKIKQAAEKTPDARAGPADDLAEAPAGAADDITDAPAGPSDDII